MLWTLLQASIFQHFRGMGSRDAWCGYENHQHPCAMMFLPLRGLAASDPYREHLIQLDLEGVIHVHVC